MTFLEGGSSQQETKVTLPPNKNLIKLNICSTQNILFGVSYPMIYFS